MRAVPPNCARCASQASTSESRQPTRPGPMTMRFGNTPLFSRRKMCCGEYGTIPRSSRLVIMRGRLESMRFSYRPTDGSFKIYRRWNAVNINCYNTCCYQASKRERAVLSQNNTEHHSCVSYRACRHFAGPTAPRHDLSRQAETWPVRFALMFDAVGWWMRTSSWNASELPLFFSYFQRSENVRLLSRSSVVSALAPHDSGRMLGEVAD